MASGDSASERSNKKRKTVHQPALEEETGAAETPADSDSSERQIAPVRLIFEPSDVEAVLY